MFRYIYNRFLLIQEAWTNDATLSAPHKADMLRILTARWDFCHSVVHSAAYLLNPTFLSYPIFEDNQLIGDFKTLARSLKIPIAQVMVELESYKSGFDVDGIKPYSSYDGDIVNMELVNPIMYWRYFGHAQINLQKIAKIVFSMIPSSSMCETNFRDTEYVYSKRRLGTTPTLANKLIFVYANSKLK